MSQHRKLQPIGRGPQSFSRSAQSPIQSPMAPSSPMAQQIASLPPQFIPPEPVYSVEQDIQDLAMEIYARLAVDQIASAQIPKLELLRDLAKASHQAAVIYFETLGATIEGNQPNGQQ